MAYQNGSLKKVTRKEGKVWLLRFRMTKPNGSRVENTREIGAVGDFPTEKAAWLEVDRRGLRAEINKHEKQSTHTFAALALRYLGKEHGEHSGKAKTTTTGVNFYVRNYLIPRWGTCPASDIKRADIRDWLYDLRDNEDSDLKGPTVSKIKSVMGTIYNFGIFEEIVTVNPCAGWRLKNVKSVHVPVTVTPAQAKAIIGLLEDPRHKMLVLVCASTAVRASEACGLKWRDIDWATNQIRIERRWTAADLDEPKTKRSKLRCHCIRCWRASSRNGIRITPYARATIGCFRRSR